MSEPDTPHPEDQFDLRRELDEIPHRRKAWVAQLQRQGLGHAQAGQLAQRQSEHHMWELETRAAARDPERYYGSGSPESHTDRAQLIAGAEREIAAARVRFEEGQARLMQNYLQARSARAAAAGMGRREGR